MSRGGQWARVVGFNMGCRRLSLLSPQRRNDAPQVWPTESGAEVDRGGVTIEIG
eukprot:m.421814 g.421814  ORF g.421814 m.421814 type:complete len:54 (-) comp34968_c0_seq1:29-190(-)